MFFLFASVVFWGLGALLGAPYRQRCLLIFLLWLGIVSAHASLPADNGINLLTGGSTGGWLVFGGCVVVGFLYVRALGYLKGRRVSREVLEDAGAGEKGAGLFAEEELRRYARHIVLREIGGPGQKALKQARVLVVGAGGLGSPVLLYLGAAGVGRIAVVDDDRVDQSNLQRQVIHDETTAGRPKVHAAAARLGALNSFVEVTAHERRLDADNAAELIGAADIVLDGCDNFETRYLVNKTCVALNKSLISGALSQWEGQVSVFDPRDGGPCYQCIFPEAPAPDRAPSCAEAGVVSPLPGVIGSMMALEAVKLICGAGAPLVGEMLIYDALYGESRKIRLKSRVDCPVCGKGGLHQPPQTP